MSEFFPFDVFLSHSSKDKVVVRALADRLRSDGLKVWFDEWEIKPGDSIPTKIEEGLEQSRVLLLCMSANAFGSDWAQLESGTFRFRDPLNKERRFIPLRLDEAPIKGSLAQFLYINWQTSEDQAQEYAKIFETVRLPTQTQERTEEQNEFCTLILSLGNGGWISSLAWSPDGKLVISGSSEEDSILRLWEVASGRCIRVFECQSHSSTSSVGWSPDGTRILSGSNDKTIRLWDVKTGKCLRILEGHTDKVISVGWSPDGTRTLSGSDDQTIRLWDVKTGKCLRILEGHTDSVRDCLVITKLNLLPTILHIIEHFAIKPSSLKI